MRGNGLNDIGMIVVGKKSNIVLLNDFEQFLTNKMDRADGDRINYNEIQVLYIVYIFSLEKYYKSY